MTRPRIGSLCTGYGGLDMGAQAVIGGTVAWHCENDPDASKVLTHHWPDVPNHGDITTVDWAQIEIEPVDLLTAGFPCQDISYAGRGAGIVEGNRSGLWHRIADTLGVLRPRWVLLENVGAIVARRPGLDVVLADLARLGFDAEWTCVRASDIGAPHQRLRWFCLATDANDRAADRERPRPQPRQGGVATDTAHVRYERSRGRRYGSTDGGGSAADTDRTRSEWREPARRRLLPNGSALTDTAGNGRDERWPEPAGLIGGPDAAISGTSSPDAASTERGGPKQPGLGATNRPAAKPRECISEVAWGAYTVAIRRWEAVLRRPAPSPTEPGAKGGQRLAPGFVEWMQGLPAGHVTAVPGLTRNAQLRILGNGVVPQQAAAALRMLLGGLATAGAA